MLKKVRRTKKHRIQQNDNRGPFRGPTQKNVYQTIDLGAGKYCNYLYAQARKYPNRIYLAVDTRGIEKKGLPKNVKVGRDALRTMKNIVTQGKKARHIHIAMGTGELLNPDYLKKIAEIATKVLLPNGKVHFVCASTHNPEYFRERIAPGFEKQGFRFRIIKTTRHSFQKYSEKADAYWEHFQDAPWQYEFTYSLKKAIPDKNKRRNWPRE